MDIKELSMCEYPQIMENSNPTKIHCTSTATGKQYCTTTHKLTLCNVSEKNWDTKEDKDKSVMYVQHDIKQWKYQARSKGV